MEEDRREVQKGKGKGGREGGSRGLRGGIGKNEGRKVEIWGKGKRKGLKGGARWGQRCWKEEKKTGSQKKERYDGRGLVEEMVVDRSQRVGSCERQDVAVKVYRRS